MTFFIFSLLFSESLSVDLSDYPEFLFNEIYIVYGAGATVLDLAAATNILANIKSEYPTVDIEVKSDNELQKKASLVTVTPNPFNAMTFISYTVIETETVTVDIFDITGQKIITLADSEHSPGVYTTVWKARNCSSSLYFYRVIVGNSITTGKLTLIK